MAISTVGKQSLMKLDQYDKKILWELELDSRMPKNQLAKKLGISPERLHYKIERLTAELIEPAIILNYTLLNMPQYIILLDNLEQGELKKIQEEAPVLALVQSIGRYQYILYVLADDINLFCRKFLPSQHFQVYPVIKEIADYYNPFNFKMRDLELKIDKQIELDKKDYSILYSLSKNPIESVVQISEKTGIDRKTINSRIKKMLDSNVIQKFRYAMNIFKLGVTTYFLKIDTTPQSKEKILSVIRANNYSGFIYETYTGFFAWYMPPSHKELFEFTKHLEAVDSTIKVDAMQSADLIKFETVSGKVLEVLKSRAELK